MENMSFYANLLDKKMNQQFFKEHWTIYLCNVYIDDIIIFSKSEEEHHKHLQLIFNSLDQANMKAQLDKCEFVKQQVEFLGFIVSEEGIKTYQEKVSAIHHFPTPQTLKELRSFLEMSGYYRRFIRDFAILAKPLTKLLRGEDGWISKNMSSKKKITLDKEAIKSFEDIKKL